MLIVTGTDSECAREFGARPPKLFFQLRILGVPISRGRRTMRSWQLASWHPIVMARNHKSSNWIRFTAGDFRTFTSHCRHAYIPDPRINARPDSPDQILLRPVAPLIGSHMAKRRCAQDGSRPSYSGGAAAPR